MLSLTAREAQKQTDADRINFWECTVMELTKDLARLNQIILEKDAIIAAFVEQVQELTAENQKLKELVNQNSQNSSRPPSKDGFNKPEKQHSLREKSGKKAGAQLGHEGHALSVPLRTDEVSRHEPESCGNCPHAQECKANETYGEIRYEVDVTITTHTTAHQVVNRACVLQGGETLSGVFPKNITGTVQYGDNVKALAVALNTEATVSISRTHDILSGVFGLPVSTGTIAAMVSDFAEQIHPTIEAIKEILLHEPVLHQDETGTPVNGKTQWAHVACTEAYTYIDVEEKRGIEGGMESFGILPQYRGISIHDCLAAYFHYTQVQHGLCNEHILRELTGVHENTNQAWSQAMIELLLGMKSEKEALIAQGESSASPELLLGYSQQYEALIDEAKQLNPVPEQPEGKRGKPKMGKTRALIERLEKRKENVMLFMTNFAVPFTNNTAEQAFRMFKVKSKVAGCFRTALGARQYAWILSFVKTAKQHGMSAYGAMVDAMKGRPFAPLHNANASV